MSPFDWKETQFSERSFHALVYPLARTDQQQGAHDEDLLDETEVEHDDDIGTAAQDETATVSPRRIASSLANKSLIEGFLDRLGEVMAREVDTSKKGDHVLPRGTLESKGRVTIYHTRNGDFDLDALQLVALQANCTSKDTSLLEYSLPTWTDIITLFSTEM